LNKNTANLLVVALLIVVAGFVVNQSGYFSLIGISPGVGNLQKGQPITFAMSYDKVDYALVGQSCYEVATQASVAVCKPDLTCANIEPPETIDWKGQTQSCTLAITGRGYTYTPTVAGKYKAVMNVLHSDYAAGSRTNFGTPRVYTREFTVVDTQIQNVCVNGVSNYLTCPGSAPMAYQTCVNGQWQTTNARCGVVQAGSDCKPVTLKCWDGTVITQQSCDVNGKATQTGATCPIRLGDPVWSQPSPTPKASATPGVDSQTSSIDCSTIADRFASDSITSCGDAVACGYVASDADCAIPTDVPGCVNQTNSCGVDADCCGVLVCGKPSGTCEQPVQGSLVKKNYCKNTTGIKELCQYDDTTIAILVVVIFVIFGALAYGLSKGGRKK
jgi:hypothetical protein